MLLRLLLFSVYTNVIAATAINFALLAANILELSPIPSNWSVVADNLVVLFNETSQMHPEYEGYTDETVKQADVILLGFPLMYDMPASVRANDLLFYGNHTDPNGPAMTWAMFAVGWLDYGDYSQAASYFKQGYANIHAPFNVWQETPTGGTVNFITGAGGFLQSVIFGYGGVRLVSGQLLWNAQPLPQNATSVKLMSLHYLGASLNLAMYADSMEIELVAAGTVDLQLVAGTQVTVLEVGSSVSVAPQRCVVEAVPVQTRR